MRRPYFLALCSFLYIFFPYLVSSSPLARRAALEVIFPSTGDTIVADDDALYDITWKNSTSNNVTISLRQGPPDNMTLVHVIGSSTFNNGSYAWRGRDDRWLSASSIFDITHSGCNYSMEFRTGGEIINSGYFTVLNAADGGILPTMTCPTGVVKGTTGPGAPSGSSTNSENSTNSTSSTNGTTGANEKGISTAALGGAVGGAVAGVLLLIGLLFFVAKKVGWIISRRDVEQLIAQQPQSATLPYNPADKGIAQADGGQIYQMA